MKKTISLVLIVTMLAGMINVSFAESEAFDTSEIEKVIGLTENIKGLEEIESFPLKEESMPLNATTDLKTEELKQIETAKFLKSSSYVLNQNLPTSFNTVTGPITENGANEPKFSYNRFLEENISDYSGELTLNFEDLVLDGRNGLDLKIGRTYQTVASNLGEKTVVILPNKNGYLQQRLVNVSSTYLLDRYNLGVGWGFSFPSVQVETEYIPKEVADTYYYDKETELYYHSGNGDVYQVEFTADAGDSNLKGYYNKDIQFNANDTGYSNGQISSHYSMTLSDKTKQYFAEDGRLLGIVDRFGNTIKFEHKMASVTNRVPQGTFAFIDNKDLGFAEDMWISSEAENTTSDTTREDDTLTGSDDGHYMIFDRNNENGDTYILSRPIQINPMSNYELGMRFKNPNGREVTVSIIGYDTAYNQKETKTIRITNYDTQNWVNITEPFSMKSSVRYIQIKISPKSARDMCIDTVTLDEPKPLIDKITDSVGRTIKFDYTGDINSAENIGAVNITVTSPDGSASKVLQYNKSAMTFDAEYMGYGEQKKFWCLQSSNTEGNDGKPVSYRYYGGATINEKGNLVFSALYSNYTSRTSGANDSWSNKLALNSIVYKDRQKVYEYETVRKNLGVSGFYDTLRIKKKYDMYTYVPEGETVSYFKGELGTVNYSYQGTCNGTIINNETGYPTYVLTDETMSGEKWTVTKTGKNTETVTFSNCHVIERTNAQNGVTLKTEYENHSVFKNSPVAVKTTTTQNGQSKETYIMYSYNDWGGVATETKEVTESIKNNPSLLPKYTTSYQYNDFRYVTKKSWYNDIDGQQINEINTYNTNGLLISSENAEKEKTDYFYENGVYPFLLTKAVTKDPMGASGMLGGDRVLTYSYDSYGLYPVTMSESYAEGVANTSYVYDYITGDILKETLPDNSSTEYMYYQDGRVKAVLYPKTKYSDDINFRVFEEHLYISDCAVSGYGEETLTVDLERIRKYYYIPGTTVKIPYMFYLNFYDAVGNLKQSYTGYYKTENSQYVEYARSRNQYYHDTYDRLTKTADSENHTVLYTYDGFDRPITVTDSEGNVYTYSYNDVENKVDLLLNGVTETTDRKLLTQYFDLDGNVIKNVVYPDNSSQSLEEEYEYDLNNNVISYTNPKGNKTQYSYDALGRLTETILPNGERAESHYSPFNEPTFEKVYDSQGKEKLSKITYRNEKGDAVAKFTSFDKKMTDTDIYSSNAKGRTTSVSEGENTKSFVYDETDNITVATSGNSQVKKNYNWFGEISSQSTDGKVTQNNYGYDVIGNLSAKVQDLKHSMAYAYSSVGNITQSLMPSERLENYTYTANGNLNTIVSDGKTFDYDYYDTGFVKSVSYPNGLKTTYEYDNINRITKVETKKNNTSINTFQYEYDNNGNVTKEIKNGAQTSYSYDSLDRLISVTYSDGSSVSYEYDALNNRTKETYSNGNVKTYVYDEKYQLKEIKLNGETTDTFTYNESGAVITHNNKTYTYDAWDRLSGFSDGTNTYTYKYDANGIRTGKNDKQYIVDINNNVVAETDSTGQITDEILWGHMPLARKTNGSWYYYIYNAHGDVVGLVDDSGNIKNTYTYDAWGNILTETETVDNPIKYAGEYYDDELDMIYLRARYYDPQIARFTSLDIEEGEIASPLDMNRYVYCRNNPIKYVDPTGREGVAFTMLWDAFFGGGKNKDYSYNQEIVRTFYSSPNLNKIINANFEKFKKSGLSTDTYSESVSFYGNDLNPNDLDLHLAVGLADYSMTFTKEIVKKRFLWMIWEETVYNVKVTISDRYNFDNYREGQHFSDFLNNLGYDWQKSGSLKPYYWSVTFMKKGL